mgnify:FL=1
MKNSSLGDLRLLYVEDDDSTLQALTRVLSKQFKEVITASDGAEGLDLYRKYLPDMVLTDLTMPKMTGLEMSAAIKEIDKDAIIIALSAQNNTDMLLKAIEIGLSGYILKPVKLDTLLDRLISYGMPKIESNKAANALSLLKQYQSAVDASSIVSKTNARGMITFVNDRFCEICGYAREELIGTPHNIVRHPSVDKKVFEDLWATIRYGRVWRGIIRNKKKNGDSYYVDSTVIPIFGTDGAIVEYIAIRHDVTELETARAALRSRLTDTAIDLEERIHRIGEYKKVIDATNYYLTLDGELKITYVNSLFCKALGVFADDLEGVCFFDLTVEGGKGFASAKADLLNKKKHYSILRCTVSGGDTIYLAANILPIENKSGSVVEYSLIMHDITEIERLSAEIEATQKELLERLGAIAETRSKETGNHIRRVSEYSYLLATLSGMKEDEATLLRDASPMHDIGKIGIPDAILNKPGRLDDEEMNIMRTHVSLGYEMLKNSERKILRAASVVALEHHEKWDGTGYPAGKKEDEIHIFGRITAIADVFDALGSDRVYKKGWELERILEFFNEQKGRHFDPILMDIFLANLDEFLKIRDTFKD